MNTKTGYRGHLVRSVSLALVIAVTVQTSSLTDPTQSAEPNIEGEYICPDTWRRVPSVGGRTESFGWAACVRQNESPLPWKEAQAECRGQSGHLLVLDDAFYSRYEPSSVTEDDISDGSYSIVYNELRNFIDETGFDSLWLGLRGSRNLLRWEADTPINYQSRIGSGVAVGISWVDDLGDGESCGAVLNTDDNHQLTISMVLCQRAMQSVCVKPATKVLLGTYENEEQCGDDWLWSADSEFCYRRGDGEKTSFDALSSCVSQNATLATPTDSFLHNFTIAAFVYSLLDFRSLDSESTFWIGLYANGTTSSGDQWSYSYGNIEFDQEGLRSGCLAVRISRHQPSSWYETTCEDKMGFICQKPKKLLGEPQFIIQPMDAHILSSEVQGFQLGCRASNVHPRRSIVWVKVNSPDSEVGTAYIDNGSPPSGNYLNLNLVSGFLGVTNVAQLQGYYRCEVWGIDANSKRGRVASHAALVKFEDIVTLRGAIVGQPDTSRNSLLRALSLMMTQANLRYEVDYGAFDNRLLNQTLKFAIYVHVDRPNNEDSTGSQQFQSTEASPHSAQASLKAAPQSYVSNRIHRNVMQQLSVTQHELIRNMSIRRTDSCADWLTYASDGDVITFPVMPIGSTANSRELCVFDGNPLAIGRCKGDFTAGGVWKIESSWNCSESQNISKSRVTERLAQLDRMPINDFNMAAVTSALVDLTRDTEELVPLDVSYVSSILSRVTELPMESNNETVSAEVLDVVDSVMQCSDERLFEAELMSHACSRIIASLESFADHVVIPSGSSSFSVSRPNVAVNVYDLPLDNETAWIYGIEISRFTKSVEPIPNSAMFSNDSDDDLDGAVQLSRDVLEMGRTMKDMFRQSLRGDEDNKFRITFITHSEGVLFQQNVEATTVNSVVLSASVSGIKIQNLSEPVAIVFRPKKYAEPSSQYCAFWDVGDGSTGGRWSTEGVETDTSMINVTNTVICRSRHLTNFAVIAGFDMPRETIVARALEAISIVGLILSIVGLDLTILSQVVLFRRLKRGNSQLVLMHLSVSLLVVDVLVIAGLDKVDSPLACKSVAALLLYFLLVSFSWMLVEAVVQYLKFVVVFNTYTSKFMMKTALPAYIVPALIVAIVVIIDVNGFETLRGPVSYCWLSTSAFYFAFLLPLGLVMLTNIVLFVMIIKGLTCDRAVGLQSNQSKQEIVKLQVMALISCFIVMGLTWVFAFFAFGQVATVMHFLFCIFNSLQGFLIFAFLNVRERPVRRAWLKLFARCRSQAGASKTADGARPAASGNSSGADDCRFNRRRLTYTSGGETEPSAPSRTSRSDATYDKLTTDSTAM